MSDQIFETYQSPFSWRYASPEMRNTWSEVNKRTIWRQLWVYLAQTQKTFGLVSDEQINEMQTNMKNIDVARSLEIEEQTHHDLVAEIHTYAEQCPKAAKIIHLGATSMDIKDNAEVLQTKQALQIVLSRLKQLLLEMSDLIDQNAELACMAFTHLQPAEPTTLGYRFANYAQDLLMDWEDINRLKDNLKAKGFKGAVGTASSYRELFNKIDYNFFEENLKKCMGIDFFPVSTQTYTRKQDYSVISSLASLGASLYKIAFDIRLLQSQPIGEIQEPFGENQVGSSAMPFKRNPIRCEKIDSLARALSQMPQTAWNNAGNSLLERTLDDSANRRSLLPEAFLICDELLISMLETIRGLRINYQAINRNLFTYAPFSNTEKLMMSLVKAGANRQDMHSRLRDHSLSAWKMVEEGHQHHLVDDLKNDVVFQQFLSTNDIEKIMKSQEYLGIAPYRSRQMAECIRKSVE